MAVDCVFGAMDDDFKTTRIPTKRKRSEVKILIAPSTPVSFDNRCPVCQFPFVEVNDGKKLVHLQACPGARAEAEECSMGVSCIEKEKQHFHNFSHYNLALSRSHEESKIIKDDISHLGTSANVPEGDHKHVKKRKISGTWTSQNTSIVTNDLSCNLTGQVLYSEEIVTSKKMTVSYGALNFICEICKKKNSCMLDTLDPHVKINFSTEDKTWTTALKQQPVELDITYNEQGWKKISINFLSGFEVKVLELILGNCCHYAELKCIIGKENLIQEINERCSRTLAFFDFASLGLNSCISPEKNILEKLWINSEVLRIDEGKEYLENQSSLKETPSSTYSNSACKTSYHDSQNFDSTEYMEVDRNDAKEKWKNLFKKKIPSNVPVANAIPTFPGTSFPGKLRTSMKSCPYYKRIPGTSFVVDAFQYGIIPGVSHYFLTHFHSDHYCGLTKNFKQRIICSPITAALVKKKLYVEQKYLYVVKPMETSCIGNVKVTSLHANHCPGSLMFLFELDSGHCYLHVGDFRADSQMEKYPALCGINVDILFLDTTYCNPRYEFPTQEVVVEGVIEMARRHIDLEPYSLFVCGTYTIGKEKVFMGLADALKCNVWASKAKREVLKSFNDKNLNCKLVEDPSKAQVHLWPMGNLNHQELEQHLIQWKRTFTNIVAFNPSGWNFKKGWKELSNQIRRQNVTIISIPYSEHSSYNELRRFVKFLRPKKVIPTVTCRNQTYSAITECCNKWLTESEEAIPPDRQQKLTSFFNKN